jgi:hypothetical protein
MPAAHQRSAICPSRQRLTLPDFDRQIEIIDSMALVERSVRASVGGTPSRRTVSVSARPSRRLAAADGLGLVQLAGQRGQLCLGLERRVGVIGGAHPSFDAWAEPLR